MPASIAAAVRSPFAAADGVLAGWHPVDLAVEIATAALARADIAPATIDHVWVGCDEPVGAQGANPARAVVLAAGWPSTITGTTVEAAPHSGLSALGAALAAIESGRVTTAMVIGMNSASIVQPGASALARLYGRPWGDAPADRYADDGGLVPPIVAADRAAVAAGIDRTTQDAWGLGSVERAGGRTTDGVITVAARPGESVAVQKGTPVDADVVRTIPIDDLEPIFDEDGTTTTAGFAPAADGIAVVILRAGGDGPVLGTVSTAAADPFDVARPAREVVAALEVAPSEVAAGSASAALTALAAIGVDPAAVDPAGGTIATGDAGAAEDLRVLIDGLHHTAPGSVGAGVRVAAGAAAGCVWRRP